MTLFAESLIPLTQSRLLLHAAYTSTAIGPNVVGGQLDMARLTRFSGVPAELKKDIPPARLPIEPQPDYISTTAHLLFGETIKLGEEENEYFQVIRAEQDADPEADLPIIGSIAIRETIAASHATNAAWIVGVTTRFQYDIGLGADQQGEPAYGIMKSVKRTTTPPDGERYKEDFGAFLPVHDSELHALNAFIVDALIHAEMAGLQEGE